MQSAKVHDGEPGRKRLLKWEYPIDMDTLTFPSLLKSLNFDIVFTVIAKAKCR